MTEEPFVEDMYKKPTRRPNTDAEMLAYRLVFSDLPVEEKRVMFRRVFTVLPSEDTCGKYHANGSLIKESGCGLWKPTERVIQIMRDAGRVPSEAFCRCPSEEERKREEQKKWSEGYIWSNLPHNNNQKEQKYFDNFRVTDNLRDAYEAVMALISGKSDYRIVTLCGPSGSGKTHLLEAAGRWCLGERIRVRYDRATDYLESFQRAATDNHPEGMKEWALREKYNMTRVLLIDDVGMDRPTEYRRELLDRLVDDVIQDSKPERLIVATNLIKPEMEKRYDARLASRLFDTESGIVKPVPMIGEDMRAK